MFYVICDNSFLFSIGIKFLSVAAIDQYYRNLNVGVLFTEQTKPSSSSHDLSAFHLVSVDHTTTVMCNFLDKHLPSTWTLATDHVHRIHNLNGAEIKYEDTPQQRIHAAAQARPAWVQKNQHIATDLRHTTWFEEHDDIYNPDIDQPTMDFDMEDPTTIGFDVNH